MSGSNSGTDTLTSVGINYSLYGTNTIFVVSDDGDVARTDGSNDTNHSYMPELDQTQWELGQTPPAAPGAPPLTNPQVTALLNGISTETTRAQGVEASLTASISTLGQQSSANAASIAGEVSRATTAEQGLSAGLTAETIRATAAETSLGNSITTLSQQVTSLQNSLTALTMDSLLAAMSANDKAAMSSALLSSLPSGTAGVPLNGFYLDAGIPQQML